MERMSSSQITFQSVIRFLIKDMIRFSSLNQLIISYFDLLYSFKQLWTILNERIAKYLPRCSPLIFFMVSEPCLGCDLVGHGPACFRLSHLHLTLSCLCPITTLHHAPSPINLVSLQLALSTTPPPSFGPVFCNHSLFKIF